MAKKPEAQRGTNRLRRAGHPSYSQRLRDYLGGDHTALVSDAFKAAVSTRGKQSLDLESLTWLERSVFADVDPRWQYGPDGVLLWEPSPLTQRGPEDLLDCSWLPKLAAVILQNQYRSVNEPPKSPQPEPPQWLKDWSASWARWGYRHLSVVYDRAKQAAEERRGKSPTRSAGLAGSACLAALKAFFLEYLPQSRLVDEQGRWPTPEVLLDPRSHPTDSNELRDDFWKTCCTSDPQELVRVHRGKVDVFHNGSRRSADVLSFLDFVAKRLSHAEASESLSGGSASRTYRCPFVHRSNSGAPLVRDENDNYSAPPARHNDRSCSWISREYPHLSAWEEFSADFVAAGGNVGTRLGAVSLFVGRYLATAGERGQPGERLDPRVAHHPLELLKRENRGGVPDDLNLASEDWNTRRRMVEFIEHILQYHCTVVDEVGPVRLAEYGNPFSTPEYVRRPVVVDFLAVIFSAS